MGRFACGVLFWLGLSLSVMAEDAPSRPSLITDFLAHSEMRYGSDDDTRTLEGRLYAWARQGESLSGVQSRAAKTFGLKADLADALVMLTLERGAQGDEGAKPVRLVARYIALAQAHPESELALVEAARTISVPFEPCDVEVFDRLLQGRPHIDADRRSLFKMSSCLQLLTERTSALAPATEPYITLATDGGSSGNALLDMAVLRLAEIKIAHDPAVPRRVRLKVRLRHLDEELDQGRLAAAVALLPDSPRGMDEALHALLDPQERLSIAAAHFALGHAVQAQAWRDDVSIPRGGRLPTSKGASSDDGTSDMEAYEAALLDRLLHPVADDAFDLLVGRHRLSAFYGRRWASVWAGLYDRIAIEQNYQGLVEPVGAPQLPGGLAKEQAEAVKLCHRCAADLLAMIDTVVNDSVRSVPPPSQKPLAQLPAPVLRTMQAALAEPRPDWVEHALPAALRRPHPKVDPRQRERDIAGLLAAPESPHRAAPPWARRLPAGELVRYEQQGQRVVAVTVSQTLDPTGEISAGGYWVSLSDDGGEHFHAPLYTGLRMFEPYVVLTDSRLPMLAGDHLQLEVAVRRLDDRHVRLPPINIPLKERRDDLYIDMPLAMLARDSDGDGITDIAEWAMLLDAHNPDTDGDGLPDGFDPLPQVASSHGGDAHASALAAVLNQLFDNTLGAIVTTAATAAEPAEAHAITGDSDRYNGDKALFIQAPAAYFSGITVHGRMIVLNPEQAEALSKVRGLVFITSMPVFEVSHDGTMALVVWSTGWSGGTFLLHRDGSGWKVERLQGWIT